MGIVKKTTVVKIRLISNSFSRGVEREEVRCETIGFA